MHICVWPLIFEGSCGEYEAETSYLCAPNMREAAVPHSTQGSGQPNTVDAFMCLALVLSISWHPCFCGLYGLIRNMSHLHHCCRRSRLL